MLGRRATGLQLAGRERRDQTVGVVTGSPSLDGLPPGGWLCDHQYTEMNVGIPEPGL